MKSYKDLCIEIDMIEVLITEIARELRHLHQKIHGEGPKELKGVDYSATRVSSSRSPLRLEDMQDIICRIVELQQRHKDLEASYKAKLEARRSIDTLIDKWQGSRHYRVMQLRFNEGMTVEKIAEKVNLSDRQVYNILKQCK